MKKWTKWILPTILTLLLAIPLSVHAGLVDEDYEVYKDHGKMKYSKGGWVHHEMYLNLLVERYAPETAADWGPALAEKKRLSEELKRIYEANPDRAKKEMKAKRKSKDEKDPQREQMRESYRKFEEAVQSKDEARIKEALNEQLINLKEHNKRLASRVAELKQE